MLIDPKGFALSCASSPIVPPSLQPNMRHHGRRLEQGEWHERHGKAPHALRAWRGPLPLQVDMASIVHVAAKARMRFQSASVRQVDRTRSNIIDRGAVIIVGR